MEDRLDYHEVVIHACTGDTNVLMFDDRKDADQSASIVRVIARSGQDMSTMRNGQDPESWFKSFPDWAHVIFVCVAGRSSISGDTVPFETHTFLCAHRGTHEQASRQSS